MPQNKSKRNSITYKDSGVDIDAGNELIDKIKPHAKSTFRKEVLGGLGGFGSMFEIPKHISNPVLVSGTDGVGTKLKLAFELNQHDTIGQDLVAMCANDIIVQGAEPLFLQIDLALISSPYLITPMLTPEHGFNHKAEGA